MKKVLIINYYWPPAGGPGVQRWVRFSKSLPACGWEPVVYTPKGAQYTVVDEKLADEVAHVRVLRKSIVEPYRWFSVLTGQGDKEARQGYRLHKGKGVIKNRIGWFIRGNLFIPDARCLWIRPSVKRLSRVLEQERFDAVVSTGPPHSLHLIAARLHARYGIPWLADFRDPWTTMGYYRAMPLTAWAHRRHRRLEEKCVRSPNAVVVVGREVQQEFKKKYGREAAVIHNGYDDLIPIKKTPPDKRFTLVHIGAFFPGRNCEELWRVLARMTKRDSAFDACLEIKLVGATHETVAQSIRNHGLSEKLNLIEYIPFHATQQHLLGAQLLLLAVSKIDNAKYVIPGKLFEYLKARRPILSIAPTDGDAAAIIAQCRAGKTVDFYDEDTLEKTLAAHFANYLKGKNDILPRHIEAFSGTQLTKKLAAVLDRIA